MRYSCVDVKNAPAIRAPITTIATIATAMANPSRRLVAGATLGSDTLGSDMRGSMSGKVRGDRAGDQLRLRSITDTASESAYCWFAPF
jgi:hypothetical protein